jgi:metallo-beta-lactamase family protein
MLADSAHIQEEDARYMNRKRRRDGDAPLEPIYDKEHATAAVAQFRTISYRKPFGVARSVRAEFFDTGHMLGSAGVHLTVLEPGKEPLGITFSGDLGRFGVPILHDPADLPPCDYLICESTYGGRTTPPVTDLGGQLEAVMADAFRRGGKVIVPAFSVGRTQNVVYTLNQLMHEGRIPKVQVFIDSPLSVNATEVFRMHPECYDREATEFFEETGDILGSRFCTYIESVEQSKALQKREGPCVIISASGMCENGRILHHLKNSLGSPKNTLLIVGYQASHTLGRRLAERQKEVKIYNQNIHVKSRIEILEGFSSHADRNELQRLTAPLASRCRRAFLVHGEGDQMQVLARDMRGAGFPAVEMPLPGDTFELNGTA